MRARSLVPLVAAVLAAAVAVAMATASAKQAQWGPPVGAESPPGTSTDLNTASLDGCPILSPDGLSLYMASNRPGGLGGLDIWVARRESPTAPFGAPVNAGAPVNTAADDFCPSPMKDGWLFFVSARPGGCGDADIYLTRPVVSKGRWSGWWPPLHLGCHVNSAGQEASPYLLTHERTGRVLLYFSSNRPGGYAPDAGPPDADLYVSHLSRFGFRPAQLVPGLNTASDDARPNLRADGLEIVFDSTRPGGLGAPDLYASTRASVLDPWGPPQNLGATVNSAAPDTRGSLSQDGATLHFGSSRPGGEGSTDIYVATR